MEKLLLMDAESNVEIVKEKLDNIRQEKKEEAEDLLWDLMLLSE